MLTLVNDKESMLDICPTSTLNTWISVLLFKLCQLTFWIAKVLHGIFIDYANERSLKVFIYYSIDNKVDGATFLLLERDELKEIVKSVGTIKQLQELQKQLLVSILLPVYYMRSMHSDCCKRWCFYFRNLIVLLLVYNQIGCSPF